MTALMPVLTGGVPEMVEFDAAIMPAGRLNPIGVESEDIRLWVEARKPVPIRHWNDLGAEEHARAFAVARTMGQGVIDDLYQGFYAVVAEGGTEVDFVEEVTPILRRKGWLADRPSGQVEARLRLIYDTNLRLARASGRWTRYHSARSALPYLRGVTGRDERVRRPPKAASDHRAWEGIILPIDHPFWTRWWPPLGFRCRCNVIQMTRSQLARFKSGGITSEGELAAREARLGEPIFAAPAAGIGAQLADVADLNNADRTPGIPAMLPGVMQQRGTSLWHALLADEALKGVEALLRRLFG
jgi:hypothetical protein